MDKRLLQAIEKDQEKIDSEPKWSKRMVKSREVSWKKRFKQLANFKKKFGHTLVCASNTKNKQLLSFVHRIRNIRESLSKDKIDQLDAIDFCWSLQKPKRISSKWYIHYNEVNAFYEKYGHCRIPSANQTLFNWICSQKYKRLSEEQIRLLNAINFSEVKKLKVWHRKVELLIEFKEQYGHLYISQTNAPQPLASFVKNMRHFKYKLSQEQINYLDEIGFVWNPGQELLKIYASNRKHVRWLKHYEELKQFKEQYGHWKVPTSKKFRGLYTWVSAQKRNEKLTDKQKQLLDEIDFLEDQGYLPWKIVITRLRDFKNNYGHLHINHYLTDDKQLMNSVKRIRLTRHWLSPAKISLLNDLEFVWKSIDPLWIKYYEDLKACKKQNGTFLIPETETNLHRWVYKLLQSNNLSPEKLALLNKIGFSID